MIVEVGHFALVLGLFVALAQFGAPLAGLRLGQPRLLRMGESAAPVLFALILGSFLALVWAHVTSDFSVLNVFQNSHSTKPLIYKISGVWGNHEGSMMLWVLILTMFGAAVALFGSNLPLDLRASVLSVQGAISATFILFIIATSNPFIRIPNPPADGQGLNPILQDPALAIHPPMLYTGYVGFSIAFSFAIAALMLGRVDSAWARWVRPWTLAAWIFLTIGIALGSWWSYYELGWGGFWFWDPVENASLMPWLTGTALLHSAIVMEKRDSLKAWTILLAILTFSLSLLGTFLVRSGVLTSVHAFANDPRRGVFILAILALFTGGSLGLFAWRAGKFTGGSAFALISREGSLVLNNLLLTVCCGIVLVGTLYPLVDGLLGTKISVGAPFFDETVVFLFLPLLLAVPFGIFLAWKRGRFEEAAGRLAVVSLPAAAVGLAAILAGGAGVKEGVALALAAFAILGSLWEVLWRAKFPSAPLAETWRRLRNLRRGQLASTIGHAGMGITIIGIAASTAWNVERLQVMKAGDAVELAGYHVVFEGAAPRQGPNYTELAGSFALKAGDRPIGTIVASKRKYDAPPAATTEAGIAPRALGDVYVVLGDEVGPGSYVVRLYFHPFVRWIWGGALIMFLAGLISLADRRLRVGLPRRAAKAAAALPAE